MVLLRAKLTSKPFTGRTRDRGSSHLIFFSLAGHLVGFILVGKVFRHGGYGQLRGEWVKYSAK